MCSVVCADPCTQAQAGPERPLPAVAGLPLACWNLAFFYPRSHLEIVLVTLVQWTAQSQDQCGVEVGQ